ncbi:MAG TPA: tetratricopeptide repeat protein [Phycisphaerae bacterium]|nr:tetratricopeptide repeat protein [Phycisphaerae bacterium]
MKSAVSKIAISAAVAFSTGLLGCAQPKSEPVKTYVTREGVIDESPALTPAGRAQRFEYAFKAGLHWVEQKQYGVALGAFEEAVAMNPESTDAIFNLGACYEQVGEPLRAIQLYRQVLSVTPNDPSCYANLGTSYIKMYHLERSPTWRRMAIDAWNISLRIDGEQPDVRRYLAQADSIVD